MNSQSDNDILESLRQHFISDAAYMEVKTHLMSEREKSRKLQNEISKLTDELKTEQETRLKLQQEVTKFEDRCRELSKLANGFMYVGRYNGEELEIEWKTTSSGLFFDNQDKSVLNFFNIKHAVIPEDLHKIRHRHSQLQPEEINEIEYRLETSTGDLKFFREKMLAVIDPKSNQPVIYGLIIDITHEKQFETNHQKSEAQFRTIFEYASVGIAFTNTLFRITKANQVFQELLGYTEEELSAMLVSDITHPDDFKEQLKYVEEVKNNKRSKYTFIKRYIRKDQSWFWARIHVSAFKDELGNLMSVVIIRDITNEKEAEEKIRQNEEQLQWLLNSLPIAIALYRNKGVIFANRAFLKTRGLATMEELLEAKKQESINNDFALIHDEDYNNFISKIDYYQDKVDAGETIQTERRIRKYKENNYTWYQCSTFKGKHPDGSMVVVEADVPIEERKQAELALKESEARYRQVVETQSDFVLISNRDTEIEFGNEAFWNAHGITLEQTKGKTWKAFIFSEDYERVIHALRSLSPHLPTMTFESRDRRANLEIGWTQWLNRGFFDSEGTLVKIQSVGRDITALKRAELSLRATQQKLLAYFNSTAESIFLINRSFTIIGFNKVASQYVRTNFGIELQEGDSMLDYVEPKTKELFVKDFTKATHGEKIELEIEVPFQESTIWWDVKYLPIKNQHGEVESIAFVAENINKRKTQEIQILELNALINSVTGNVPGMVFRFRLTSPTSGKFDFVSPQSVSLNYCSPDDLIQTPSLWIDPILDEDKPSFYLKLETAFHTKGMFDWEGRKKINDNLVWRKIQFRPNYLSSGDFVWDGIETDITLEKERDQENVENQDFLRSIYYGINTPIFVIDVEQNNVFRFVGVNPAYERNIEIPSDLILGKTVLELSETLTPEISRQLQINYEQCVRSGSEMIYEESILWKGKRLFYMTRLNPLMNSSGEVYRIVGNSINITKRKETEERLKKNERMLSETERLAKIGSIEMDLVNNKVYWSNEVYRLYERSFENPPLENDAFYNQIHPDDRQLMKAAHQKAALGKSYDIEIRVITDKGNIKWVRTMSKPVFEEGKMVRYIGSVMDISKEKEVEVEKEKIYQQLIQSQKMESLGILASGVAHEFNNILAGILGNTALLKKEVTENAKSLKRVIQIEDNSKRAATIVKQMLGFARQGKLETESIDLTDCIKAVLDILEPTLDKRISVSTTIRASVPKIDADKGQIEQVLLNLAVNARDAILSSFHENNQEGSLHFELNVEVIPATFAQNISLDPTLKMAHLVLRDTGVGIPQEIKEKIFEPFFSTKEVGKGTGLGLSMVYGIVKNHRGFVFVESEVGRGTTVHLYFPPSKESIEKAPPNLALESIKARLGTILLIDDEPIVLDVLQDFLREKGFHVLVATNGKEGLFLFQKHQSNIDLVLMDKNMPEMEGEEVMKRILKLKSETKMVLITGYLENDSIAKLSNQGDIKILTKPFEPEALLSVIAEVLA